MIQPTETSKITFIGAGNVAWHLAKALHQKGGYIIREIWSRRYDSAAALADKVESRPVSSLSDLSGDSDIYILAVSDSAIPLLNRELQFPGRTVVHTAGSVDMHEISSISSDYGVLYPLQTFSKNIPLNLAEVPICIEASNPGSLIRINDLAHDLSGVVKNISSKERLILHVAAVFASNYSNLMYTYAGDLLSAHDLSFDLLKPLVAETARKAITNEPARVQTGPAKRGDQAIIDKHLQVLADMPEFTELYDLLAQKIKNRFSR
jgi:predicted short-subunit dehydrogenase-like oxidoreductase (DUF2520 family)